MRAPGSRAGQYQTQNETVYDTQRCAGAGPVRRVAVDPGGALPGRPPRLEAVRDGVDRPGIVRAERAGLPPALLRLPETAVLLEGEGPHAQVARIAGDRRVPGVGDPVHGVQHRAPAAGVEVPELGELEREEVARRLLEDPLPERQGPVVGPTGPGDDGLRMEPLPRRAAVGEPERALGGAAGGGKLLALAREQEQGRAGALRQRHLRIRRQELAEPVRDRRTEGAVGVEEGVPGRDGFGRGGGGRESGSVLEGGAHPFFSTGSTGPPASTQARKPPPTCATASRPSSCAVRVASAERQPLWQKNTKRFPASEKNGLW